VASVALFIAVLALGWSVLVFATGGFEARIFGATIRSHDVLRPFVVGGAALVVFLGVAGFGRIAVSHASIVAVLAASVFVFGYGWATCAAAGADAYGYLSQARLWMDGPPLVSQSWAAEAPWPLAARTFAPLGYRPVADGAIAPVYAVGLPLLMAAVNRAAGYGAVFLIVPAAGALLIVITYALGRDLASPRAGLTAAFLTATNATLLGEVTAPMSDVVLSASLLTGLWCLVRRPHPFIAGAGVACGVAVLVRPNLAPTVLVLALWVAARPWFAADVGWSAALRQAAIFLAMAAPGFLVPAWANWRFFGSPFESGYGSLGQLYDARRIPANLAAYVGHVFDTRAQLALVGLGALALPAPRLWPAAMRSRQVAVWLLILSVVVQYLAYEYAANAGYLRFFLPCLPLALIGLGHLLWFVTRPGWPSAMVVAAIVAAGAGSVYAMAGDRGFDPRIERRYAGAAAMAAAHTERHALMISMQHSGSVRYYGARMSLRYDWLDPAWLDRSVAWLEARGHPVYALLDAGEVDAVRRRFVGQARASGLDAPIAVYRGAGVVYLFDLTRPLAEHPATVTVVETFAPRACVPPAPPAPFDLSAG
jgi:hypothetical protein